MELFSYKMPHEGFITIQLVGWGTKLSENLPSKKKSGDRLPNVKSALNQLIEPNKKPRPSLEGRGFCLQHPTLKARTSAATRSAL